MPLTSPRISRRTFSMGHDHDQHGHHHHAPTDFGRAFLIGIFLNAGFIVLEVALWISRIRSPFWRMPATTSLTCSGW